MKNEKGITLIFIALVLVTLLALAGLAIDISYMYFVKNELQVAADASALAGASQITNPNDFIQEKARQEAWEFACKNKATSQPVFLQTNGSNCDSPPIVTDLNSSNDPEGDIVVGNWKDGIFSPTTTPVNAIKTRPRRTGDTPGMPQVSLFLGKIINWPFMSAKAEAIATRPPRPTLPLVICIDTCSLTPPLTLLFKEKGKHDPPDAETLAWTNFLEKSPTPIGEQSDVVKYIQGKLSPPDVCCKKIATDNGVGVAIKELQDEFNLQIAETGLPYWEVVVPVVGATAGACPGESQTVPACPPGDQSDEPYLVSRYATIRIISVTKSPDPGITISSIQCVTCPASRLMGKKAALVK